MHAVVMESLEEYLSGSLAPVVRRNIEAHLSGCPMCRSEVRGMQDLSNLFGSLQPEVTIDPSGSFFAGIMQRVEEQKTERKAAPSFAGLFGLDAAFGRRLVFASLLMLAATGSYLVSREKDYPRGPSPESIMAQQSSPAFDTARAEDNMLVTLTAYEQR